MSRVQLNLSVYINDLSAPSEVFLRQLLDNLGKQYLIEVLYNKDTNHLKNNFSFKCRALPGPFSTKFLLQLLPSIVSHRHLNIRLLYRVFLLEQASAHNIYFPFLYMLNDYEEAILLYKLKNKAKIFSSIRGTEITMNPFTKPNTINTYHKTIPFLYKLHFLSELLLKQYTEIGLKEINHQIIYQGVDLSKFLQEINLPTDKLRIISIGRFNFVKGIEYLILACKKLKDANVNFSCSIVGYGAEKEKYLYMIHDLKLNDHVTLQENIQHSELPNLLINHNLYVHPHIVTGISNSMLEAFASGLKVLAFDSAFDSYLISNITSYFNEVPRYDVNALASEIQNFNFHYNIPKNTRLQILEKFTLHSQIESFINFFEFNTD